MGLAILELCPREKEKKKKVCMSMRAIVVLLHRRALPVSDAPNRVLVAGYYTEKRQAGSARRRMRPEVDLIIYASFSFHQLQQHQRGSLRHHRCHGIRGSGPKPEQPGKVKVRVLRSIDFFGLSAMCITAS